MGRSGYGRVGGRKSRSAAWQWMIIGATLGFGCAAIIVLALLTAEVLSLNTDTESDANAPVQATEVSLYFTDTPASTIDLQATMDAGLRATLTALQPATPTIGLAQIVAPSATSIPPTPDAISQTTPTDVPTTSAVGMPTSEQGGIPAPLQGLVTNLMRVDGGTFQMGTTPQEVADAVGECRTLDQGNCEAAWGQDSSPSHTVTVDTFWMEETEVTTQQYVAFLNWMGPRSHQNGCFGQKCVETTSEQEYSNITFDGGNYEVSEPLGQLPVVGVTWYGARAYCEATGRRLPTEAEWERAARGENNFIYPWGNERELTYTRTSRPDRPIGPVDVGSYPAGASQYGLLDMAGNVAEWAADYYSENYYSRPEASELNPTGPVSGSYRVIRGGSWDAVPFFARAVQRQYDLPDAAHLWLGFRCAANFEERGFTDVVPGDLGPTPIISVTEPHEALDAQPTLAPPPTAAPAPTEAPGLPPAGNN